MATCSTNAPGSATQPISPPPAFGATEAFRQFVQIPTYTSVAFIDPVNFKVLHVTSSTKALHRENKISQTQDYPLLKVHASAECLSPLVRLPMQELPTGRNEFFAPGGHLKGVLVTRDKERYIEVWDLARQALLVGKKVTKEVGRFLSDEQWGQPVFSPDAQKLLFVAHTPPDDPAGPPKTAIERYRFTPTWGELQRDLTSPGIFLFSFSNLSAPNIRPLLTNKQQVGRCYGQAQFGRGDGGEGVVCVGFEPMEDERRLGVVYCTNRRSSLWWFPLAGEQVGKQLTSDSRSARSPRILQRRDKPGLDLLVWLSNPLGGPHNSCATLHCAALKLKGLNDSDILVEEVEEPSFNPHHRYRDEEADDETFPGLYLNALPAQPFLWWEGRHRLALTSTRFSHQSMYIIDLPINSESVQPTWPRCFHNPNYSTVVLGTDGHQLVATSQSNLVSPPLLRLENVGPRNGRPFWSIETTLSREASDALRHHNPSYGKLPGNQNVETLSTTHFDSDIHADDASRKLLLVIHGGPHSTSLNIFTPALAAFAVAGYEIAAVNYTGSLGFGQRWVEELIGKCGERDVADCWAVVEQWRACLKPNQTGKVFVLGGSHGGFLAAHLTSKHPQAFTAAVLRNPVISLGENLTVTDIPDWVFNEFGLAYPLEKNIQRPSTTPTAEQYKFLQSRSPIGRVEAVTAHTLILMGEDDRRVPPSQSKAWYHGLKGKSARAAEMGGPRLDVECLAFPGEGHALDGVVAELACFEATLEWFERYAGDD